MHAIPIIALLAIFVLGRLGHKDPATALVILIGAVVITSGLTGTLVFVAWCAAIFAVLAVVWVLIEIARWLLSPPAQTRLPAVHSAPRRAINWAKIADTALFTAVAFIVVSCFAFALTRPMPSPAAAISTSQETAFDPFEESILPDGSMQHVRRR